MYRFEETEKEALPFLTAQIGRLAFNTGVGARGGYYIEDGVHRAVAARQNGLKTIPAVLYEPGKAPRSVYVPVDELHSPKASVSLSDPRHNYPALEAAMATPLGRSKIPPISIQPLGAPGQTQAIPLGQVKINP